MSYLGSPYNLLGLAHVLSNLFSMVVVVSKSGVDIGKRDLREVRDDFFRSLPLHLVPHDDVLDTDPIPGNPRLSTTDTGCDFDMF